MRVSFDASVFLVAFAVTAMAEVACLSRTVALVLRFGSPFSLWLGVMAGNIAVLLPVLLLGDQVSRWLPESVVRIVAGLIFLALGVWTLLSRLSH
jgi:putative Ca2+/H+ antiporter (TMEM165/GDT1 family)